MLVLEDRGALVPYEVCEPLYDGLEDEYEEPAEYPPRDPESRPLYDEPPEDRAPDE